MRVTLTLLGILALCVIGCAETDALARCCGESRDCIELSDRGAAAVCVQAGRLCFADREGVECFTLVNEVATTTQSVLCEQAPVAETMPEASIWDPVCHEIPGPAYREAYEKLIGEGWTPSGCDADCLNGYERGRK